MCEQNKIREQREYAWNYFHLHASQRMSSFNFFVVFAALLSTATVATFKADCSHHWLGIPLGLALGIISYVFWKMDQRVRYLIKHAEAALKTLEEEWKHGDPCHLALFSAEEQKTSTIQRKKSLCPSQWHLSYSQCFAVVYIVFAIFGILGALSSLILERI